MVQIKFNQLLIESISQSSGVFSGDNYLFYWRSSKKENQGFGEIHSDYGSYQGGVNIVNTEPSRGQTGKKE